MEIVKNSKEMESVPRHLSDMVEGSSEWLPEEQAPAFIDDVSAGKSLTCMELESLLRFSQRFTVQMDPAKETQECLQAKTWETFQWSSQSPDLHPTERAFSYWRKRDQQKAAAEVGCSKGLAERLQGGDFLTISLKVRASY